MAKKTKTEITKNLVKSILILEDVTYMLFGSTVFLIPGSPASITLSELSLINSQDFDICIIIEKPELNYDAEMLRRSLAKANIREGLKGKKIHVVLFKRAIYDKELRKNFSLASHIKSKNINITL